MSIRKYMKKEILAGEIGYTVKHLEFIPEKLESDELKAEYFKSEDVVNEWAKVMPKLAWIVGFLDKGDELPQTNQAMKLMNSLSHSFTGISEEEDLESSEVFRISSEGAKSSSTEPINDLEEFKPALVDALKIYEDKKEELQDSWKTRDIHDLQEKLYESLEGFNEAFEDHVRYKESLDVLNMALMMATRLRPFKKTEKELAEEEAMEESEDGDV